MKPSVCDDTCEDSRDKVGAGVTWDKIGISSREGKRNIRPLIGLLQTRSFRAVSVSCSLSSAPLANVLVLRDLELTLKKRKNVIWSWDLEAEGEKIGRH